MSVLIDRLSDGDPGVRRTVAEAFEKSPELSVQLDAISTLAKMAAGDPNKPARLQAIKALGSIPKDEIIFHPGAVKSLERSADDTDADISAAAQNVLVEMGARSSKTQPTNDKKTGAADISSLVSRLKDADEVEEQCLAATELSYLEKAAHEAVPTLVRFIKHRKGELYDCALEALRRIEPAAEPERLPRLIEQLEDEDIRTRIEALMALEQAGPDASKAFAPVMTRVKNASPKEIPFAIDTACAIVGSDEQRQELIDGVLSHLETPSLHPPVARALEKTKEKGAEAVAAAINHDDPIRRLMTARIVSHFTEPAPHLLEALKLRLSKEDRHDVWAQILRSLERFNALTLDEVSGLIERESNPEFRESLITALPRFEADAVPVLIKSLRDRSTGVGLRALESLGKLKEKSGPAASSIIALDNPSLAEAMGEALAAIGPQALPEVLEAMGSRKRTAQKAAIIALGAYGATEPAALSALIALLDKADRDLKELIIKNLGRAGPAAASAVPHLVRVLRSRDQWLGLTAIASLGDIGKGAASAVESVVTILRSTSSDALKRACVKTLGKIAPYDDKAAAEVIRVASNDPSPALRVHAIEALKDMESGGARALSTLRRITKEDDPRLRTQAAAALLKIGDADDILAAYSVLNETASREKSPSPDGPLTSRKSR